ncbi:MAG: primosomal protein N' [Gammaproteobacteria bacterium]
MAKLPIGIGPVFKVALAVPVYRLFDYLAPEACESESVEPGIRLEVPFGRGRKIAFLIRVAWESELGVDRLKRVTRILDRQPLLSASDLRLLHWASRYYHYPLGEVFAAAFPAALRLGKSASLSANRRYVLTELGRTYDARLMHRAKNQKKLLDSFQSHQAARTEADMAALCDQWRPALRQLKAKALVRLEPADAGTSGTVVVLGGTPLQCNPEQQSAVDNVVGALDRFGVFLLEGVTGSGKTEVYMQIIRTVLERGQQILVLLPEITLTPQLEDRFRQRFSVSIAISHSKLSDRERQNAWVAMQQGLGSILLGTRSALFTPLKNPGLIILDEEHDVSFKQQEGFRFSARDVAVVRGKMLDIPVLLGSATPSLESLYNVRNHRYRLLQLPNRAGTASEPVVQLLDIRNKSLREGLSEPLIAEMTRTLTKREQVLLFLNRRGFAPTLICHGCGWVARCRSCDANLVIHIQEQKLRCHHCGQEQGLPKLCPACGNSTLIPAGVGTERVERVLADLFPDRSLVRLDRDSVRRKGSLEEYLRRIGSGQADIILGTQMLAKGHHFPNVTLVAILDVDSGLYSIDFHSSEKLAQMIVQVSGRAGRADKRGKVILQTRHPDHPLLTTLIHQGYDRFAEMALEERRAANLPPYNYQALLRAQAAEIEKPREFLTVVKNLAERINTGQTQILGPIAAPMARRAGRYRHQLLFQDGRRSALHALLDTLVPEIEKLKLAKHVRWSLDVDPVDLY